MAKKMSYVILKNPKSISSTTTVKKDNYYVVYNFEEGDNTVLLFDGRKVSKQFAENYEIRFYDVSTKKSSAQYREDYSTSLFTFGVFLFFGVSVLIFGKK